MSKFYRDKKSFFASILKGSGLYLIAGATLLVLFGVAAILLPKTEAPETVQIPVTDPISSVEADPTTTDAEPAAASVSEDVEPVPADVVFCSPVAEDVCVSVKDYSGTAPVFSETMQDWRVHQGMDFCTASECDVTAAADGTVDQVYRSELMGVSVEILHEDGSRTVYQSLAEDPPVIAGQEVHAGDVIGKTGTTADCEVLTGYHLHFALLKDGVYADPAFRIGR